MLDMDNRGEGTSWVGDLFRKFESLCCDMDGVLRQEIGHVEHLLQDFGAKVAQFCSNMDEEVSLPSEEEKESDVDIDSEKESDIDIVEAGPSNIGIDEDHYEKDAEKESDIDIVDAGPSNIGIDEEHYKKDSEKESTGIDEDHYKKDSEKEPDIVIVEVDPSIIGIDKDHYKKDSRDANNSLSSCSVQPFDKVEIESAVKRNIDSRTDRNFGVTDEEIHLAPKEETLASEGLMAGELDNYMMVPTTSADTAKSYMKNFTMAGFLEIDLSAEQKRSMETLLSSQKATYDDIDESTFDGFYEAILDDIADDDLGELTTLGKRNKQKKRKLEDVQIKGRRQSSKEADHESKQAGHELPVEVIQKSEESETNPEFDCVEVIQKLEELNADQDSDWVIV